MSFKVGDRVQWESQASGSWTEKRGVIVAIVPASVSPFRCLPGRFEGPIHRFDNSFRDHESYLVQVRQCRRLYRPRVSSLALDSEAAEPS